MMSRGIIHPGVISLPLMEEWGFTEEMLKEDEGGELSMIYEMMLSNKYEVWREKLSYWVKEIISDLIGLKILVYHLFLLF